VLLKTIWDIRDVCMELAGMTRYFGIRAMGMGVGGWTRFAVASQIMPMDTYV